MHRVSANKFHGQKKTVFRNSKAHHAQKSRSYIPGRKIIPCEPDSTSLGLWFDLLLIIAKVYVGYKYCQMVHPVGAEATLIGSSSDPCPLGSNPKNTTMAQSSKLKGYTSTSGRSESCYIYVDQVKKGKVKNKKKNKKKTKKFEERSTYALPVPCPKKKDVPTKAPSTPKSESRDLTLEQIEEVVKNHSQPCPKVPPCPEAPKTPECPKQELPKIPSVEEVAEAVKSALAEPLNTLKTADLDLSKISERVVEEISKWNPESRFENIVEASLSKFLGRECPPCEGEAEGGLLHFFRVLSTGFVDKEEGEVDSPEARVEYHARKFLEAARELSQDKVKCWETLQRIHHEARMTLKQKPTS